MKVGTLSLNINTPDYNYGAMLHSYAFILFLKSINLLIQLNLLIINQNL